MKKRASLLALWLLCLSAGISQTLPEVDIPITSNNYFEICQQLDTYFAVAYHAEADTECWDNQWVKYQRWKWWWRGRVQADGSFPNLRAQWMDYQRFFSATAQARDDQPTWINEGPSQNPNYGYWGMGRTKHIAFHPNDPLTFFVGTPDGGLWKTSNGGHSWIPLGDGLPYLPVGIILINPQNPNILYISLGDKGGSRNWNLGVYKSTDGGNTWAPTGLDWELSEENVIYNMVMSADNPQVIFAATNHGIRRTTDGGNSWQTVQAGVFTDIKFRPGDPSTLYAASFDLFSTSEVLKSTNGGSTWTQVSAFQTPQNELRLAVSPLKPDWLGVHFNLNKRFLLSKDGGHTYVNHAAPADDFGIFNFSPSDSNVVYLCGVSVSRSSDLGATWEKITHWYNDGIHAEVHADAQDLVLNPHHPNELWYCNDGGLYQYNESTHLWTDFSDGLAITQFYRIAVSQTGELKIAAGSQDNGGWLRTPNGWQHTNGGDAMCQIIDPTDNNIIYTEYIGGNDIFRSTNGYITSVNIADNIPGNPSGGWITPFILNPKNPKTFIVAFEDVFCSYDRGDHFHKISDNLTGQAQIELTDIAMAPSDTNTIVALLASKAFITTNGGQNWVSRTVASGSDNLSRIFIHPANAQRMWATKLGYSAGNKVFTTTNSWQSSQNISGNLPNVPVNCILYDALTNYLIVGTDIGVFYTDADQINWKPYGIGMPAVYVLDLKLRHDTRKLYAGTYARGVYSVDLQELVKTDDSDVAKDKISVFPNPAHHVLLFKSASTQPFEGDIALFDAMGRCVFSKNVTQRLLGDIVLEVSSLPAGLYFLKALNKEQQVVIQEKVVIE